MSKLKRTDSNLTTAGAMHHASDQKEIGEKGGGGKGEERKRGKRERKRKEKEETKGGK